MRINPISSGRKTVPIGEKTIPRDAKSGATLISLAVDLASQSLPSGKAPNQLEAFVQLIRDGFDDPARQCVDPGHGFDLGLDQLQRCTLH